MTANLKILSLSSAIFLGEKVMVLSQVRLQNAKSLCQLVLEADAAPNDGKEEPTSFQDLSTN